MLEETLLSTEEERLFEISTPKHVRPQGVGDNECSEMVTFGLQVDSVSRPVMMLLKMLMAVLHTVNLQTTSLCSTTFTDVNYTYCLIKVLDICVIVLYWGLFVLLLYCFFYVYLFLFVLSVLV